ncbi:MAG: hypothetical protein JWP14_1050 [Frankiales bacterium]|nr:hypothetical protein [Frankiales bacterium]
MPAVDGLHEIFNGCLLIPARDDRTGGFADIAPAPGGATWRVFEFAAGVTFDSHFTCSIDFDVVLDGEITLGLDAQEVLLVPGDCVLIQGDSHVWRAGSRGCRMLFALLGASA